MNKVIIRRATTAKSGYCLVANKLTSGEIAYLLTDKTSDSAAAILKAGKPLDGVSALACGSELAQILHAVWVYDKTDTENALEIAKETDIARESVRHAQAKLRIANDSANVRFSLSGLEPEKREAFIASETNEEMYALVSAREALASVNEKRKSANEKFDNAYLVALQARRAGRAIMDDDNAEKNPNAKNA